MTYRDILIERAINIKSSGNYIPVDLAMQMAEEGCLFSEFEGSLDGFSVEKFIELNDL
jgi:hypothetical protein